jgi:hypothetical protein
MSRPFGVTVLSIVLMIAGAGFVVFGAVFFFMGSTGANATAPTNGPMATLLSALGAATGVIFLVFGALHVVLALGILQMRSIARVFTILLFLVSGAGALLGVIATLISYSHVGLAWNLSLLVLDAGVLWYLFRPAVKKAFAA